MEASGTENHRDRGRLDTVLNFAKENGYENISFRCEWNGMEVFEMILGGDAVYVGIPQFVITKKDKFRIANYDEAMEILDVLSGDAK